MHCINLLLSSFHNQYLLMISHWTLWAAKLNDLFCPGSKFLFLIKMLKSTRPFIPFFNCNFFFCVSSLWTIWSTESFFDRFLRFFGFLLISSILISFFFFSFWGFIFFFFWWFFWFYFCFNFYLYFCFSFAFFLVVFLEEQFAIFFAESFFFVCLISSSWLISSILS